MMPRRILTLTTVLLALAAGIAGVPAKAQNQPAIPGATVLPDGNLQVGDITVRRTVGELAFPAKIVLEAGPLEVIIAHPHGRLHETLLVTEVKALQVQTMLYLLGAENGQRLPGPGQKQGTLVDIDLEWTDSKGEKQRQPIENWIQDRRTEKTMRRIGWTFVGSIIQEGQFLADVEGNVVVNYSVGSTVLDVPDPESLEDDTLHSVHTEPVRAAGGAGKAVTVVFKPRRQ
ncbi:MAG TPA: YdjY domain-containing protein [Lentisphaeria bacterium]|nr:YdjY domain-containing protein [Lentisphaeria bacterium]